MKKSISIFLVLFSITTFGQKITELPIATGQGIGGVIPIVQGGVTKKINVDSLSITAKLYADSLKRVLVLASNGNAANIATNTTAIATNATAIATKQATLVDGLNFKTIDGSTLLGPGNLAVKLDTIPIYLRINQNSAAIGAKQNILQSGINLATVNGVSLLTPQNIVIAGASSKALYRDLITNVGGTTLWNFDSSSTAKITTSGTTNIDISGVTPTGSTGVLIVTQSSGGNDTLKYNNIVINIAKQGNKTSLVGFVKLLNSFVFSVDTTNVVIAQTGGYDADAQILFSAALTNNSYKTAVSNAIAALKLINLAAGGTAWSKSVMINGRAGTNLTQQSYNWKNPTQYNYIYGGTPTVYNPNGTQFNGGDGSTANFLKTGVIPSTAFTGTNTDFALVNVVGASGVTGNGFTAGVMFGVVDLNIANRSLYFMSGLTAFQYDADGAAATIANSNPAGRFITFYSTSSLLNVYRNGVLLDSRANPPSLSTLYPYEFFEGAGNIPPNNAVGFGSNVRMDVTQIINSKLTVAESQAIDAVWAAYETALNR